LWHDITEGRGKREIGKGEPKGTIVVSEDDEVDTDETHELDKQEEEAKQEEVVVQGNEDDIGRAEWKAGGTQGGELEGAGREAARV